MDFFKVKLFQHEIMLSQKQYQFLADVYKLLLQLKTMYKRIHREPTMLNLNEKVLCSQTVLENNTILENIKNYFYIITFNIFFKYISIKFLQYYILI